MSRRDLFYVLCVYTRVENSFTARCIRVFGFRAPLRRVASEKPNSPHGQEKPDQSDESLFVCKYPRRKISNTEL